MVCKFIILFIVMRFLGKLYSLYTKQDKFTVPCRLPVLNLKIA